MKLPQKLNLDMMQNRWASIIEPIISNPINQGNLLTNIDLSVGSNSINHKLSRKLVGWIITDINGGASIYSTQASNQTPDLTLQLTSDAAVTIALWVF